METTLYAKLMELNKTDEYPFHMPGHKRNIFEETNSEILNADGRNTFFSEVLKMDITEIEGFDNLHHPEGIIREEQEFASELFGTKETFYLVNGSTCGVLSAICGCAEEGSKIVLARNSHKSAYNGAYLKNLDTYYVYPTCNLEKSDLCGPITACDVAEQMDACGAKICFITSPTYEGILSNIEEIADAVHKRGGILIVDEAHGAHLGFHTYFPESAITKGGDIVIQSLHKTLPSMTQTALLHICSDRVNSSNIRRYLGMFQSSSPSYVLMASMSVCIHSLAKKKDVYFEAYTEKLKKFYEFAKSMKNISVLAKEDVVRLYDGQMDPSKIILRVEMLYDEKGCRYKGIELARDLAETYHLQTEMVSENYVIAMTSIFDTEKGFERLIRALTEIDKKLHRGRDGRGKGLNSGEETAPCGEVIEKIITVREAVDGKSRAVSWEKAKGEICAEYIYLYPPGSPIVVPGERITPVIWEQIEQYRKAGLNIQGPESYNLEFIYVV